MSLVSTGPLLRGRRRRARPLSGWHVHHRPGPRPDGLSGRELRDTSRVPTPAAGLPRLGDGGVFHLSLRGGDRED
eukprot:284189-Rhodomonas_salina.1